MTLPRFVVALLAAAGAGIVQALSIAVPGWGEPLWVLQVLSLAVLVHLLGREQRALRGFWLGWTFGTAWLTATFWWLFISMHTYGGLPAPLAALAVLGLAAFLALYHAAAGAATVAWRRGALTDVLLFAGAWLLAELARGHWFTGFPWGATGYAHTGGPLAGWAGWVGVYGIGALAACGAALLAAKPTPRERGRAIALALLLFGAGWAIPYLRPADPAQGARLDVALLQGNIPQDEKFQGNTGIPVALEWYLAQLRTTQASLIVTPETAIPLLPHQLPEGYLDAVKAPFRAGDRAVLAGIPLGDFEHGYTNSVLGWSPGAPEYRYDKHHLVPFGEFIPPLFKWFTRMMNIPLGDFARGDVGQPSFAWRGQRLAPNICYEDLFGEELAARFADPQQAPTIFVNMSNIGWFGDSIAIDQHLQISRMRALEFARPMLRATNTGATAIIDRDGRVTATLPRFTRGTLTGTVQAGEGITPYAWWAARFGLWPLWLLGILGVAGCAVGARRGAPYNGRFREPQPPA